MFVLISIVAVWIVALQEVIGDCNEICHILETDSTLVPHQSDCICLQGNYDDYNLSPPWYENADVSAIFFEPAETRSMQKALSLETPFSINNPYSFLKRIQINNEDITNRQILPKSLHSKRNIDTRTKNENKNAELLENKKDLRKYIHEPLLSNPNFPISKSSLARNINPIPNKIKRNEFLTENTEKLPIYIDIDVQQSDTSLQERFQSFEFSEKYVRECIDLHIVLFLRKCKNSDEFKKIWESEDIEQYLRYSDTQLKEIINMKCSQLSSVVTTSLDEIKQSWPKKEVDDYKHPIFNENVTSILQQPSQSLNVFKDEDKTSKDKIEISPSENNVSFDRVSSIKSKIVSDSNLKADKKTENQPAYVVKTIQLDLMKNNISDKMSSNENIFPLKEHDLFKQEPKKFYKMDTTEKNEFIRKALTIRPDNELTSNSKVLSTTLEMTTEQNTNFTAYVSKLLKSQNYSRTNKANFNNDFVIQNPTVKSRSQPEHIETRLNNDPGLGDHFLLNSTAIYKHGNEQPITKVPHVNDTARIEYNQSEVKIQKIITKELNNDTVISIMDGYEVTSSEYPDTSENNIYNKFSTQITSQKTYNEDPKLSSQKDALSAFTDSKNEIIGKLYFLFDDIKVPAQFVQEPDGQLRMGIDGNSLCNHLNNNYSSVLLTTLCLRQTESKPHS